MESFIGKISNVNLWNVELNAEEVLAISSSCYSDVRENKVPSVPLHLLHGNVVAWADFLKNVRGDLLIKSPSEICSGYFVYLMNCFNSMPIHLWK